MPSSVSPQQRRVRFLFDLTSFGILGGFVAGLVIPHDGGFAIALVEKFEDLVSIILLPLVRHRFRSIDLHIT